MFYSAQHNGFFDPAISGANLPPDAVEISLDRHAELLAGQSSGQVIASDGSGFPVLEDRPARPAYENYDQALRAVVRWIDALTEKVIGTYPEAVRQRWLIEEAAARAVLAGDASADQLRLVTDEGAAKDRSPEVHAAIIVQKADQFRAIADETNKLFLATDRALQEASDPFEYQAIFDAARTQAEAMAAQMGLG